MLSATTWRPRHTKILVMTHKGKTGQEIAQAVKCSVRTVCRVQSDGFFLAKLNAIHVKSAEKVIERESSNVEKALVDKAREELLKGAVTAARKIKLLMRKGTRGDTTQLVAAKDILDRIGLKPKEVIETHERVYTPEEVDSALTTVKELESVVERLSNRGSQYVIPKLPESSETDKGSRTDAPVESVSSKPGQRQDTQGKPSES